MSRARAAAGGQRRGGAELPAVEIRTVTAGTSPLLEDYHTAEPGLARFYSGHPEDGGAYLRKAGEVAARFDRTARLAMHGALKPVSPAAKARLRDVIERDGFMVTTGQQAGLFGGPLFTIYKALTAVRLADRLQTQLGAPVLPVFWIASEDHDWAEVNHTWVPGPDGVPMRISVDRPPSAPEVSMARQRVAGGAASALRALRGMLPAGPETDELADVVRRAYAPDATMADAFRDVLAWLLADFPICTISAADPVLKEQSVPLLRRAIEQAADDAAIVTRQTSRLTEAGYAAQVAAEPDATHVHFEDETGRERVLLAGNAFSLRRTKRRTTTAELLARLEADPTCISPGALLRPVIESALLPTLAYVGGPAETSYFAQIGCLFRSYGMQPPVVVPRASFLLVERPIKRVLGKLGLAAEDVQEDAASLIRRQLDAQLPEPAGAALAELKLAMTESWSRLRAEAGAIDPTLEVPLRRLEAESMNNTEHAEARLRLHHRMRHDARAKQIERVCSALRPHGSPQERVFSALPFVACHGRGLLRDVAAAIGIEPTDGDRWARSACPS